MTHPQRKKEVPFMRSFSDEEPNNECKDFVTTQQQQHDESPVSKVHPLKHAKSFKPSRFFGILNKARQTSSDVIPECSEDSRMLFLRLVILGASNVGKTSIIQRFVNPEGEFSSVYSPTIEDIYRKDFEFNHNHEKVVLEILDTSGVNDFPAMRELSIKRANAFLIVYAADDQKSFEEVKLIHQEIMDIKRICPCQENVHSAVRRRFSENEKTCACSPCSTGRSFRTPIVVCANKVDLVYKENYHAKIIEDLNEEDSRLPEQDNKKCPHLTNNIFEPLFNNENNIINSTNDNNNNTNSNNDDDDFDVNVKESLKNTISNKSTSSHSSDDLSFRSSLSSEENYSPFTKLGGTFQKRDSLVNLTTQGLIVSLDWDVGFAKCSAKEYPHSVISVFAELKEQYEICNDLKFGYSSYNQSTLNTKNDDINIVWNLIYKDIDPSYTKIYEGPPDLSTFSSSRKVKKRPSIPFLTNKNIRPDITKLMGLHTSPSGGSMLDYHQKNMSSPVVKNTRNRHKLTLAIKRPTLSKKAERQSFPRTRHDHHKCTTSSHHSPNFRHCLNISLQSIHHDNIRSVPCSPMPKDKLQCRSDDRTSGIKCAMHTANKFRYKNTARDCLSEMENKFTEDEFSFTIGSTSPTKQHSPSNSFIYFPSLSSTTVLGKKLMKVIKERPGKKCHSNLVPQTSNSRTVENDCIVS